MPNSAMCARTDRGGLPEDEELVALGGSAKRLVAGREPDDANMDHVTASLQCRKQGSTKKTARKFFPKLGIQCVWPPSQRVPF
jgi:hypothetical protein